MFLGDVMDSIDRFSLSLGQTGERFGPRTGRFSYQEAARESEYEFLVVEMEQSPIVKLWISAIPRIVVSSFIFCKLSMYSYVSCGQFGFARV